jgi:hypothetical protein
MEGCDPHRLSSAKNTIARLAIKSAGPPVVPLLSFFPFFLDTVEWSGLNGASGDLDGG